MGISDTLRRFSGKNARLPEALETTNTLERMRIGASGWTVPWAMFVDAERNCWLNGKYTYNPSEFGTANMRVTRLDNGFAVDLSRSHRYTWKVGESGSGYVGGANPLPVIKITR